MSSRVSDADTAGAHEAIGARLKALRLARSWSLDRAAEATGVSKAMLGQVERGESSPTLATLWKIATGFSLSISALIAPPLRVEQPDIGRSDTHAVWTDGRMRIRTLFGFDARLGFEWFELTLPADTTHLSEAHEAGVIEHVTVISGEMALLLDGGWVSLRGGDSVRFAGDVAHGYRNMVAEPVVFHNLIHYPSGSDR
ncbi:DNA-binding protein [Acidihalobacter yilgarnensis]|uniref:DNA-binding protein n=1 Tax=Acidihalobacter yilgarnensis TaxID=2819280 RepID=A0A1D8INK9_9GAMM|nr:XRE family transcriptional regulator [Acidihalobacter yilgarnensis]AOU98068.1 DNA-binding protein [Acidihalobacter yilgarnensis]